MATLKDLSEYTGYSIATISRILNSDPSMSASEETRKKVLEAANTLNYAATKSRKGRNLKTVLSLGIVLSCPHARIEEYYRRLWGSCIGRVCRNMKIEPIDFRFDDNGRLLSGLIGLDGIIAIGAFEDAQVQQLFRIIKMLFLLMTLRMSCTVMPWSQTAMQALRWLWNSLFHLGISALAMLVPVQCDPG